MKYFLYRTTLHIMALLMLLPAALIVNSCSPGEPILNEGASTSWEILAAREGSTDVDIVSMPGGTVRLSEAFRAANGESIGGQVTFMTQFADEFYLMVPSANLMYVVDFQTLELRAAVDFSEQGYRPHKILFANATTGYILFENHNRVIVFDRTVYRPTSFAIDVRGIPSDIEVVGNQGFITVRTRNTVVQFDTRSSAIVRTFQSPPVPLFIRATSGGERVFIVSAGGGKLDDAPLSPATLSYINVGGDQLTLATDLFERIDQREAALPLGFIITPRNFMFIPLREALVRIDAGNPETARIVARGTYTSAAYNLKRNELIFGSGENSVAIGNANTGRIESTILLPYPVQSFLPK